LSWATLLEGTEAIQTPYQEELMSKRTLTLSVLAASLMLAGPSFAMEPKKDAMMKDGMKKDTMMKKN
jgi:hypothetical protein